MKEEKNKIVGDNEADNFLFSERDKKKKKDINIKIHTHTQHTSLVFGRTINKSLNSLIAAAAIA